MATKQITPPAKMMTAEEKASVEANEELRMGSTIPNDDTMIEDAVEDFEGTYQVLTDHAVGSYRVVASFEDWKSMIEAIREDGDAATAETIMTLLRESDGAPEPGARIGVEFMPGSEQDATLDAIRTYMPGEGIDGRYQRKAKTSRASAKTKAGGGEKATRSKKSATPQECTCGCGEMTNGGKFRPGHDARFKGNLLRAIRAGGDEGTAALERIKDFPTLYNYEKAQGEYGTEAKREEARKAKEAERLQALKDKKAAEAKADSSEEVEVEEETAIIA